MEVTERNNIIPAVMHIQEASNILKYEMPELSDVLLLLAKNLLDNYKVLNKEMLSAYEEVNELKSDV